MIHKARFYTAIRLGCSLQAPLCLQYAMWALAASKSNKYRNLCETFYELSREYVEKAEMMVSYLPLRHVKVAESR